MRLLRWIIVLIPVVVLVAAEEKKAEEKKTAQPPAKGRLTLPEGAQKIEAFTHRYKDSEGKIWIYRQTPFGLTRYEEETSAGGTRKAAPAPKASSTGIKAFDEGDSVRFEKVGPFGKYTWVRRKTELSEQEKRAWEQSRKEKSPARKTTKGAAP